MPGVVEVHELRKSFVQTWRQPGLRAALGSLLRPRRREVEALRGVSFSVERGEKLAFIGPNGAGKSTTIKILTGILHPTSGDVSVLGLRPWRERRRLVARLGCVFGQRSQLWYHLPVAESFELLARVFDVPGPAARARLAELSELFELGPLLAQPVRKLSLGQRMRCELAASLIHRPELLFLDEPTIGLDVVARARIRDFLVRLNQHEGVTVFLTSHDAGDIEEVCERVLLINHGAVLLDTSVERLKTEHLREKRIEAVFGGAPPDFRLEGVERQVSNGHRLALNVDTRLTPIDRVVERLVRDGERRAVVEAQVLAQVEAIAGRSHALEGAGQIAHGLARVVDTHEPRLDERGEPLAVDREREGRSSDSGALSSSTTALAGARSWAPVAQPPSARGHEDRPGGQPRPGGHGDRNQPAPHAPLLTRAATRSVPLRSSLR